MLTQKLWSLAQIGAEWVLYLLLILSFVSITIMVERFFFFFRSRIDMELIQRLLRMGLRTGGAAQALHRLGHDSHAQLVIIRDALLAASDGPHAVEEIAAGSRGLQKLRLERGLAFLGTLGNNAPFIGLFGTVLGIINAFRELSHSQLQQAGPKIMLAISEALVATAVGLLVAIPAVLAFNIFQRRVKLILTQADALLHELLAYLKSEAAHDPIFEEPAVREAPASSAQTRRA